MNNKFFKREPNIFTLLIFLMLGYLLFQHWSLFLMHHGTCKSYVSKYWRINSIYTYSAPNFWMVCLHFVSLPFIGSTCCLHVYYGNKKEKFPWCTWAALEVDQCVSPHRLWFTPEYHGEPSATLKHWQTTARFNYITRRLTRCTLSTCYVMLFILTRSNISFRMWLLFFSLSFSNCFGFKPKIIFSGALRVNFRTDAPRPQRVWNQLSATTVLAKIHLADEVGNITWSLEETWCQS